MEIKKYLTDIGTGITDYGGMLILIVLTLLIVAGVVKRLGKGIKE